MAKNKTHTKANFKKPLLLIASIFLLIAVATYTQKNKLNLNPTNTISTENWKTYESPKADGLGYKLKYPNDWELKSGVGDEDNSQPEELSISIKGSKCKTGSQDFFKLEHFMNNNPKLEYERIMSLAEIKGPSKNAKIKQISYLRTLNNQDIVKIKTYIFQYSPSFTSYVQSDKGIYYIVGSGSWCSSDFEKNYDAIIRSLEFYN